MAYTNGIDISHFQTQSGIDWASLANPAPPLALPAFIYIKLTDGKDPDPNGIDNANNARNNGFKIGYYHYAYPGQNEPNLEADSFYTQVAIAGQPSLNYPYMLDLEVNLGLSQADYLAWVENFILTFQNRFGAPPGPPVIIYGSAPNLAGWLPAGHNLAASSPLWVANYNPVEDPDISNTGWDDWLLWQYTRTGAAYGITGNVDQDWAKAGLQAADGTALFIGHESNHSD